MAVYEDDAGDEQKWKRTITNQGASEYRINDRVVTAAQYTRFGVREHPHQGPQLPCLQGDVEAIASQSPKDLTRSSSNIWQAWNTSRITKNSRRKQSRQPRIRITTFTAVEASIPRLSNTRNRRRKPKHFRPRQTSETMQLLPHPLEIVPLPARDGRVYCEYPEHQETEEYSEVWRSTKRLSKRPVKLSPVGKDVAKSSEHQKAEKKSRVKRIMVPIDEKVEPYQPGN